MNNNAVKLTRNAKGQGLSESAVVAIFIGMILGPALVLLITIGQYGSMVCKVQCAAQAAAQEAFNIATWSPQGVPSYPEGAYTSIETVMDASLVQMGLPKLPKGEYSADDPDHVGGYTAANPVFTGVPGRYVVSVVVKYPYRPSIGNIRLPKSILAVGRAAVVNSITMPHQVTWIYGDQVPGDPCFPSGDIQKGGLMIPTYMGARLNGTPVGQAPPGTYTQYTISLIGSYLPASTQSY